MRQLNIKVQDEHYENVLSALKMLKYIQIEGEASSDEDSLLATPFNPLELPPLSALRGSISKESAERMLEGIKQMRNEWDRQF